VQEKLDLALSGKTEADPDCEDEVEGLAAIIAGFV
jgi:hypothetical protein